MSMPTKFIMRGPDELSPLRAMHSLREKHLDMLSQASRDLPGGWSVVGHEGYDGDLTAVLTPQDESADRLVVARSASGFHLSAMAGDQWRKLGSFKSLEALVAFIRAGAAPNDEPTAHPDKTASLGA